YAGGLFTEAGDAEVGYIARWDGKAWSAAPGPMNDWVYSLASIEDEDGPALYAGGLFTSAAGVPSAYIARFGCRAQCRPDCTRDGKLTVNDFICFQSEWRKKTAYGDFNADGKWDINDFLAFQSAFRQGCG